MRHLTVQERTLIFAILLILIVGACVRHFRRPSVPNDALPELPAAAEQKPTLPSLNDLSEDD